MTEAHRTAKVARRLDYGVESSGPVSKIGVSEASCIQNKATKPPRRLNNSSNNPFTLGYQTRRDSFNSSVRPNAQLKTVRAKDSRNRCPAKAKLVVQKNTTKAKDKQLKPQKITQFFGRKNEGQKTKCEDELSVAKSVGPKSVHSTASNFVVTESPSKVVGSLPGSSPSLKRTANSAWDQDLLKNNLDVFSPSQVAATPTRRRIRSNLSKNRQSTVAEEAMEKPVEKSPSFISSPALNKKRKRISAFLENLKPSPANVRRKSEGENRNEACCFLPNFVAKSSSSSGGNPYSAENETVGKKLESNPASIHRRISREILLRTPEKSRSVLSDVSPVVETKMLPRPLRPTVQCAAEVSPIVETKMRPRRVRTPRRTQEPRSSPIVDAAVIPRKAILTSSKLMMEDRKHPGERHSDTPDKMKIPDVLSNFEVSPIVETKMRPRGVMVRRTETSPVIDTVMMPRKVVSFTPPKFLVGDRRNSEKSEQSVSNFEMSPVISTQMEARRNVLEPTDDSLASAVRGGKSHLELSPVVSTEMLPRRRLLAVGSFGSSTPDLLVPVIEKVPKTASNYESSPVVSSEMAPRSLPANTVRSVVKKLFVQDSNFPKNFDDKSLDLNLPKQLENSHIQTNISLISQDCISSTFAYQVQKEVLNYPVSTSSVLNDASILTEDCIPATVINVDSSSIKRKRSGIDRLGAVKRRSYSNHNTEELQNIDSDSMRKPADEADSLTDDLIVVKKIGKQGVPRQETLLLKSAPAEIELSSRVQLTCHENLDASVSQCSFIESSIRDILPSRKPSLHSRSSSAQLPSSTPSFRNSPPSPVISSPKNRNSTPTTACFPVIKGPISPRISSTPPKVSRILGNLASDESTPSLEEALAFQPVSPVITSPKKRMVISVLSQKLESPAVGGPSRYCEEGRYFKTEKFDTVFRKKMCETQAIDEFNTETLPLVGASTKAEGWSSEGKISEIFSSERMKPFKPLDEFPTVIEKIAITAKRKTVVKTSLLARLQDARRGFASERRTRCYEKQRGELVGSIDCHVIETWGKVPLKVKVLTDSGEAILVVSKGLLKSFNSLYPGCWITIFPPWETIEGISGEPPIFSCIRCCEIRHGSSVEEEAPILQEVSASEYKPGPKKIMELFLGMQ